MPRVTLEYAKYYDLPLFTIKDYIKLYRKEFGIWLTEAQVRASIKREEIDFVKHDKRIYVVINPKSMEEKPISKRSKFVIKKSHKAKAVYRHLRDH